MPGCPRRRCVGPAAGLGNPLSHSGLHPRGCWGWRCCEQGSNPAAVLEGQRTQAASAAHRPRVGLWEPHSTEPQPPGRPGSGASRARGAGLSMRGAGRWARRSSASRHRQRWVRWQHPCWALSCQCQRALQTLSPSSFPSSSLQAVLWSPGGPAPPNAPAQGWQHPGDRVADPGDAGAGWRRALGAWACTDALCPGDAGSPLAQWSRRDEDGAGAGLHAEADAVQSLQVLHQTLL